MSRSGCSRSKSNAEGVRERPTSSASYTALTPFFALCRPTAPAGSGRGRSGEGRRPPTRAPITSTPRFDELQAKKKQDMIAGSKRRMLKLKAGPAALERSSG